MPNIDGMKAQVQELNRQLKEKYNEFFSMDNEVFRRDILSQIGQIKKMTKLDTNFLNELGVLVGVDGSVMKVGGADPHYVEIYQALAKPTKGEDIYFNQLYSPVIDASGDGESSKREVLLSQIEMDAAIYSAENEKPSIIMMDGGLIRYKINDSKKFEELVEVCIENNVILMGVIKDLKTDVIARAIGRNAYYDRELIYGRLNRGELLIINDECNKKFEEANLVSAFLRCSLDSMIIGLDILKEYRDELEMAANLVYTLTPEHSRGVPLWLDIVDAEVKITDTLVRTLLEEYMDRDIYRRFFVSERDGRTL
ncbi:NurA domain-containing protein [Peptoniphilus asaccharolyticus DSM 20463]|uniref:NurA domain-containing protein n=1 Tax=Peptoniphilus asaccharolyticus DSM 20463 TaxID=573058 RepID=A0A1W1UM27_PEPAS|nr:DNA double-strand break repair nuclease NurA [Peptoniphilus asaccharolyticus]SMB82049.1 NurA domain-containing protein [Peptoniphilus asaccharolyticus DSM 20463]